MPSQYLMSANAHSEHSYVLCVQILFLIPIQGKRRREQPRKLTKVNINLEVKQGKAIYLLASQYPNSNPTLRFEGRRMTSNAPNRPGKNAITAAPALPTDVAEMVTALHT